jgi:hypothetical protein
MTMSSTELLKIFRGNAIGMEHVPLEPPPAELKELLDGEATH